MSDLTKRIYMQVEFGNLQPGIAALLLDCRAEIERLQRQVEIAVVALEAMSLSGRSAIRTTASNALQQIKKSKESQMTDFKALHAELTERINDAAYRSKFDIWTWNNKAAILSALELAQQARGPIVDAADLKALGCGCNVVMRRYSNPLHCAYYAVNHCEFHKQAEAENANLKEQLAEAEKLNETWSLAFERAQQQLAAKERE